MMKIAPLTTRERSEGLARLPAWQPVADRDAIHRSIRFADFNAAWQPAAPELPANSGQHDGMRPLPQYRHPKKNWRLKRGATPQWYKQRNGVRTKALSGAARVARFRPPGVKAP